MKLQPRSLVSLVLIAVAFFFVLACLDYWLMFNFEFWKNPDLIYRYWIILALVVLVFGYALAFMGYVAKMSFWTCFGLFATVLLLFAGGLLDLFYALLAFVLNTSYSFDFWSLEYKWFVVPGFLPSWTWFDQAVWSAIFFGAIVFMWYRILKKR